MRKNCFASADKSSCYGAVVAELVTMPLIWRKNRETCQTVADVEPPPDLLEDFLESNQVQKLTFIGAIKQELAPLKFGAPDTGR